MRISSRIPTPGVGIRGTLDVWIIPTPGVGVLRCVGRGHCLIPFVLLACQWHFQGAIVNTPDDYRHRTWWETLLAFFFGTFVQLGRGIKWLATSLLTLIGAGLVFSALAGIAGIAILAVPFLCFAWGWMAAGPLLPHDPVAGLLMTALGACAAAIVTLPWRPVEAVVAWLTSPLRRGGPSPAWLSDASRSVNGFVLLFGALASLAHLAGYLLGFDSYLIRVVLFIGMMMAAGLVDLGERHRLAHELYEMARANVRMFRALSILLIAGSLTLGSYMSAFSQGTSFAVRAETGVVSLTDGTTRPVVVVVMPSGGFFLLEDVLGAFASGAVVPGEEIVLPAGTELSLPGYSKVSLPRESGAIGWKIRRAWWLGHEVGAKGAPVEYSSLSDPALVTRLSPKPAVVEPAAKVPAPAPVTPAPVSPTPNARTPNSIACADLSEDLREKFCAPDFEGTPVASDPMDCANLTFHAVSRLDRCKSEYETRVARQAAFCKEVAGASLDYREENGCVEKP